MIDRSSIGGTLVINIPNHYCPVNGLKKNYKYFKHTMLQRKLNAIDLKSLLSITAFSS